MLPKAYETLSNLLYFVYHVNLFLAKIKFKLSNSNVSCHCCIIIHYLIIPSRDIYM